MTLPSCVGDKIHRHKHSGQSPGASTCLNNCGLSIQYNADGTIAYSSNQAGDGKRYQHGPQQILGTSPCTGSGNDGHHDVTVRQSFQWNDAIVVYCKGCSGRAELGRHIERHR